MNDQQCRLCATKVTENNSISILEPNVNGEVLVHKIKGCLRVTISEQDSAPRLACTDCQEKVLYFHQFYVQAWDTQRVFHKKFMNTVYIKMETSNEGDVAEDIKPEPIESSNAEDSTTEIKTESIDPNACRLCLSENDVSSMSADTDENHSLKLKIAECLHLSVDENSELPECVCFECINKIKSYHGFYRTVQDVQLLFKKEFQYLEQEENMSECKESSDSLHVEVILKTEDDEKNESKSEDQPPFVCVLCNKSFEKKKNLSRHQKLHGGEKHFQCNLCHKAFSRRNDLFRHQVVHTGEKKCQCDICGNQFTDTSSLRIHKRIHTGEKPYQCGVCGKSFLRSNDLNKHRVVHTGEKPYECDICGNAYTVRSTLIRHRRTHIDGENAKPHVCTKCCKSFQRKYDLMRHTVVHTGEKPYQCNICQKAFSDRGTLTKHRKQKHTDEIITQHLDQSMTISSVDV